MIKVETLNSAEHGGRMFYAEINPGYWWKPWARYWFEIHDHNEATGVTTTWAYEPDNAGRGHASSIRSAMLKIYDKTSALEHREWLDEWASNHDSFFEEIEGSDLVRWVGLTKMTDEDGTEFWVRDDELDLYAVPEFIEDLEEVTGEEQIIEEVEEPQPVEPPDHWARMHPDEG